MGLNLKLMQGIEREEAQIQREKQVSDAHPDKPIGKMEETRKESGVREMPSDPSEKTPTGSKKEGTRKSGTKSKKKENTDKKDKQVFSFRAFTEEISIWRAFATATDVSMENLGTTAMNEFINRHKFKLSGTELEIFELLLAREKK